MACQAKASRNSSSVSPTADVQAVSNTANVLFDETVAKYLVEYSQINADAMIYVLGCLIFCATAAHHPEFLSAKRRLQSFVAEEAGLWASAGFFLQPDVHVANDANNNNSKTVSCFHCGFRCSCEAGRQAASDETPLRRHLRGSPNCELARLLSCVATANSTNYRLPAVADVASKKLRHAIVKLNECLLQPSEGNSSGLLNCVESYGFSRPLVAFVACREFMLARFSSLKRPGDLIQRLQDSKWDSLPTQDVGNGWLDEVVKLDVEKAIVAIVNTASKRQNDASGGGGCGDRSELPDERGSISSSASSSSSRDSPKLPNETTNEAEANDTSAEEAADELCVVCRHGRRSHVTLPCAHFAACGGCLRDRPDCPKCCRPVLATLRAFIT